MLHAEQVFQAEPAVLQEGLREIRPHQANIDLFLRHLERRAVLGKAFIKPHRRGREVAVEQQVRVFVEYGPPIVVRGEVKRNILAVFAIGGHTVPACPQEVSRESNRLAFEKRSNLPQFLAVPVGDDLQLDRGIYIHLLEEQSEGGTHLLKTNEHVTPALLARIRQEGKMWRSYFNPLLVCKTQGRAAQQHTGEKQKTKAIHRALRKRMTAEYLYIYAGCKGSYRAIA